ncbi:MAG: aldo/keto reductase [Candidatus Thiodiazotropha weberae]|nr:aldo/keto reductase [Candidatus Thiodiazotropha lotti]MCG8012578.1 aldo/keto reductase [Candidatus Thiodiazotropha lotti]MCG8021013.1 aldo/keto reductase [Candidatus Thiodiazotropha lotti]MCW4208179.1 aldo/keto reductase [Candidatus Thiodiazotropha lotti]MCW4212049.1 aldo/keto reductase [Candidatus Thiodiazotropha lotti]
MKKTDIQLNRRTLLKSLASIGGCLLFPSSRLFAKPTTIIKKPIPASGELLPVIGMGTSRTFDSVGDPSQLENLAKVLNLFFANGGSLIDSSPMYGNSEAVLGQLLKTDTKNPELFTATKVWTSGKDSGIRQMENSRKLWGVAQFDLMQIHNLVDWQVHLETLKAMKAAGNIRYIGITTSHGRDHDELYQALKHHKFDFVQLSYNIVDREVEQRLLPLAQERNIAVLANRPYARGALFRKTRGKSLPEWAKAFDCHSWGQFFLKYIVSHPAITCAIPATSKTHHMVDNMGACHGALPDAKTRQMMTQYFQEM